MVVPEDISVRSWGELVRLFRQEHRGESIRKFQKILIEEKMVSAHPNVSSEQAHLEDWGISVSISILPWGDAIPRGAWRRQKILFGWQCLVELPPQMCSNVGGKLFKMNIIGIREEQKKVIKQQCLNLGGNVENRLVSLFRKPDLRG